MNRHDIQNAIGDRMPELGRKFYEGGPLRGITLLGSMEVLLPAVLIFLTSFCPKQAL